MGAPGWYPDPLDPASLQYHDGHTWTEARQPAASHQATLHYLPPPVTKQLYEPYRPVPQRWPPTTHRARPRRRRAVVVVGAVVIAAALTVGLLQLHRGGSRKFTLAGQRIANPAGVLDQAEKAVSVLVAKRHGAQNRNTRCYLALPADPAPGAKPTDIGNGLLCGPVLFVDGDPDRNYLTFPFTAAPAAHGALTLTAATTPVSPDPTSPPPGYALARPDARTAPAPGDLAVPAPPPAPSDALLATYLTGPQLAKAPPSALMVSLNGGIRVDKLGVLTRYGSGDDARVAAAGQRLVAFTYSAVPGQIGDRAPSPGQLTVSVDHGAGRRLPALGRGQAVVVAVPSRGGAELVFDADDVHQTIALPRGTPGADNLAVLRRQHIDAKLAIKKPMTISFVRPGSKSSVTGTVTASCALIGYWTDDGRHRARDGGHALLWLDLRFRVPHQRGQMGVDPQLLTLVPERGAPIPAKDLDPSDRVFAAFEVPADFSTGTVAIKGSEGTNPKISVTSPVTFPLTIPD